MFGFKEIIFMSEIDKVHDILTDLLCSVMEYVPYEKPEVGTGVMR
jgi:hypothetical protein